MIIKMTLNKDTAQKALETYMATLIRKRTKETNLLIVELLDKDVGEIKTALNSIVEAK